MNSFQIAGIIILILFYGTYFFKIYSQRRKGIRPDRLEKENKDFSTLNAERTLKRTIISIAVIQISSLFIDDPTMSISLDVLVRYTGFGLAFLGFAFFLAAVSAMGENRRAGIDKVKQTRLVTDGIYRYTRNPVYVGFDLFYIGITLAFPNWILLIVSCMGVVMMHFQILEEERHLPGMFGEAYRIYKSKTPRYLFFL